MYRAIRKLVSKNNNLFAAISFLYTPIRIIKEHHYRRAIALDIISKNNTISSQDKKIYYFGIPEHNNLGDMAQTYCTRKWLRADFDGISVIEIPTRVSFDEKIIKFIRNNISVDDLFIFQSGYCTNDGHLDHKMHINIIEKFPDQPCVILPQTVNMVDKRNIYHTKKVFSNNKHLMFIARDSISFQQARQFVSDEQLKLYPDIVTSLIGRDFVQNSNDRSGVLLCIRNDKEKYYSDNEIVELLDKIKTITKKVTITDTNSNFNVEETYQNLEKILKDKISEFASYKVIITDRYHGTIFSLIANTPVIVIKTNDHKVTSGVDWFDGIYEEKAIQLADDLDIAFEMVKEIITTDYATNNNDYFYEEYYKSSLTEEVSRLR